MTKGKALKNGDPRGEGRLFKRKERISSCASEGIRPAESTNACPADTDRRPINRKSDCRGPSTSTRRVSPSLDARRRVASISCETGVQTYFRHAKTLFGTSTTCHHVLID